MKCRSTRKSLCCIQYLNVKLCCLVCWRLLMCCWLSSAHICDHEEAKARGEEGVREVMALHVTWNAICSTWMLLSTATSFIWLRGLCVWRTGFGEGWKCYRERTETLPLACIHNFRLLSHFRHLRCCHASASGWFLRSFVVCSCILRSVEGFVCALLCNHTLNVGWRNTIFAFPEGNSSVCYGTKEQMCYSFGSLCFGSA